jgi:hypothetical protein
MDKEELDERTTPGAIIETGGQIFRKNCNNEDFGKMILNLGLKHPKFMIELFNVTQKIYCQGMQHGAAMTAYGSNNNEIRNKILKVTE